MFAELKKMFSPRTKYTYEGQVFDLPTKFQKGVDDKVKATVKSITPLPTPLSQKKLVFAMPRQSAFIKESAKRFAAVHGAPPVKLAKEIVENLSISNFKSIKVFFQAVKKKNIYVSVEFVELDSMSGSYPAAEGVDALYMVEPSVGEVHWTYASTQYGEQELVYDRSSEHIEGKVQAFVQAVQAMAVGD